VSVPRSWLPSRLPARATEPIGRRDECQVLDRLLEAVRAAQSRALVVRGEPGVGKTALLDYLVERAAGCRGARDGCPVGDGACLRRLAAVAPHCWRRGRHTVRHLRGRRGVNDGSSIHRGPAAAAARPRTAGTRRRHLTRPAVPCAGGYAAVAPLHLTYIGRLTLTRASSSAASPAPPGRDCGAANLLPGNQAQPPPAAAAIGEAAARGKGVPWSACSPRSSRSASYRRCSSRLPWGSSGWAPVS
jgi:hypothetical protein